MEILKYPLDFSPGVHWHRAAPGSRYLFVGLQGGQPFLWAIVGEGAATDTLKYETVFTGQPTESSSSDHIGTVVLDNLGLVAHVFHYDEVESDDAQAQEQPHEATD